MIDSIHSADLHAFISELRDKMKNHTRKTQKLNKNRKLKTLKWKDIKPHTSKERKTMKRKYKSKCFLEPKTMKYPICNKYTGKVDCKGIYAAQYYTNIHNARKLKPRMKYLGLAKKIESLKKKNKCGQS